jgi:hypothetical protein
MLHFFAKGNHAALVQKVFRKYLQVTREFWKAARRCAVKGSPEQKIALRSAIRLQFLLIDRQTSRFAYLLTLDTFDWAHPGTIDSINQRLDQGWGENEEETLLNSDSSYRHIVREIEDIRSEWDSKSLENLNHDLGKNTKWRHAREVVASRVVELNDRLRLSH